MGDYALYKAFQSYVPPPGDTNALCFQKDDVLEISVQSPFATTTGSERTGWLFAYNRRTAEEGYVPGIIVVVVVL